MLGFWTENVALGDDVVMRPPEEYVLNITQVALTPEAQGFGSKGGIKKTIEPTILQATTKDINGDDVVSTICTLDHTCRQATVSLCLGCDETTTFSLVAGGGKGPISMTGYLQPSPDEQDEMGGMSGAYGGSSDEEDDDETQDDPRFFGMQGGEDSDDDDSEDEDDSEDDSEDDEAPMLEAASKRKRSFDVSALDLFPLPIYYNEYQP